MRTVLPVGGIREKALAASWSPDAVANVKQPSEGLNSDIHGSAEYRAHLVTVMAKRAVAERPETHQTALARQLAETQSKTARASFYPQVVARGVFEADRGQFVTQAGANWFFSTSLRWNLFNGFADRGRVEEAAQTAIAARAREREISSTVQLQVRQAHAALQSAREHPH